MGAVRLVRQLSAVRRGVVASGAVLVAGSLMSWEVNGTIGGPVGVSGLESGGLLTLAMGIVAAVAIRHLPVVAVLAGGVAGVVVAKACADIVRAPDHVDNSHDPALGIVVAGVGALGVLCGGIVEVVRMSRSAAGR